MQNNLLNSHHLKLPVKVDQDLTPKALKRSCTINNQQLVLPGSGYFVGKLQGALSTRIPDKMLDNVGPNGFWYGL